MRRIFLITSTGLTLVALGLLPAVASAHRHGHHPRREAHRRLERFGPQNPTAATEHDAGTVTSFVGETLTIRLNDGTNVAGKVTKATELECEVAVPVTPAMAADHGGRDSGGNGGNDSRGGPGPNDEQPRSGDETTPGATGNRDSGTESGDDNGRDVDGQPSAGTEQPAPGEHDHGEGQACTTMALMTGAIVHRAELRIGATGATFVEVDIVN